MNIIDAVISSFGAALVLVFAFVPKLLGFLVILLIGGIVATTRRIPTYVYISLL